MFVQFVSKTYVSFMRVFSAGPHLKESSIFTVLLLLLLNQMI